jgi:hypothetical protein
MTIFVDAGEGKDSSISFGGSGKKVVMHSKDNVFSITAGANEVLSMKPLARDSAAFKPEVIGSFQLNSITASSIVAEDFDVVNPDSPLQQWLAVYHDSFTNGTDGWTVNTGPPVTTSTCGGVTLLGGPCQTSSHILSKTFELPRHAQVKVTARFHFLDNWDDDTAWMSLSTSSGQRKMWMEQYSWCSQFFTLMCAEGHSACGQDKYPDKLSRLINVNMDHNEPTLTVQFGTSIGSEIPPCEVSYGVSSVVVEVR